jgi:hypothetical protein
MNGYEFNSRISSVTEFLNSGRNDTNALTFPSNVLQNNDNSVE